MCLGEKDANCTLHFTTSKHCYSPRSRKASSKLVPDLNRSEVKSQKPKVVRIGERSQKPNIIIIQKMANSFGELVLLTGDFHIPTRALSIPQKFQKMLLPNKMQHVLCTGNLGTDYEDMIRGLAPNVHILGNSDSEEYKIIQVGEFKIGLISASGYAINCGVGCLYDDIDEDATSKRNKDDMDALSIIRRRLNVDILVYGSSSHRVNLTEYEGYHYINPGSMTGAFPTYMTPTDIVSEEKENLAKQGPSFILLAMQGSKVVCYVYQLINDEVSVSKTEFSKS